VLRRRTKRLLLPLWAYGGVVVAATLVQAHVNHQSVHLTRASVGKALTWIVPLTDPAGSAWHGGWLSSHLWYLRAYLWIVLLAPVFVWLARRLAVSIPLMAVGIAVLDLSTHRHVPGLTSSTARLAAGDLVTYGLFAMLGM